MEENISHSLQQHNPSKSWLTPIIPSQRWRAWPKSRDARSISYLPLRIALTRAFSTDAHIAAYSAPQMPRRLSYGAVDHQDLSGGVTMVHALFDLDGHTQASISTWWATERPKVIALREVHPGIYAYRTRSGARLIGALEDQIILRTREDAEAWRQRYLMWVAYLGRAFNIEADPSCKDWTRLYRLPHATRDPDGQPENHEVIGDARHVGSWAPAIRMEDIARAATLGKRRSPGAHRVRSKVTSSTGEGLLYHAFTGRGWVGQAIEDGKWAVACPWETLHTRGERFDTSTVLWAPGTGEAVGWWHCSHAHCQHRDLRDVLVFFNRTELERAQEAAGIPRRTANGIRTIPASSVASAMRTAPATEVAAWRR